MPNDKPKRRQLELTPKTDEEIFAAEAARLDAGGYAQELVLDLGSVLALISTLQVASRHPSARFSPTIRAALDIGHLLHDRVTSASPELARILEQGWHPVFDVDHVTGDIDAVEFDDIDENVRFTPNESPPEKEIDP